MTGRLDWIFRTGSLCAAHYLLNLLNAYQLLSRCRFAKGYGELGLAGFGGIEEGGAGAVAFGGFEEESLLGAVGKAGETGFAVDVGADFEIEFAGAGESVGDMDFDFGGVDGLVVGVGDGEVGGALSDAGVDGGDGVWVGGLGEGGGEKEREE